MAFAEPNAQAITVAPNLYPFTAPTVSAPRTEQTASSPQLAKTIPSLSDAPMALALLISNNVKDPSEPSSLSLLC